MPVGRFLLATRVPGEKSDGGRFASPVGAEVDVPLHNGRWEPVTVVERPWKTNPDLRAPDGSRPHREERMLASIEVAIPPYIADAYPALSPKTTAPVEQASASIARLESSAEHLAGLGDLLVRTEAVATSKIEHVYADLDDLAQATVGAKAADNAHKTLAAARALRSLADSTSGAEPLTEEALLSAHRELLADDLLESQWAGRYRELQNWIGGSASRR